MDSEQQDDKYKMPFNDCKGTCKTPIGCTCGKAEDEPEILEVKVETEVVVEKTTETVETVETALAETKVINKQQKKCCQRRPGCCMGTHKLEVYDWLNDIPLAQQETQMVEVQFKNTRKGYYLNSNNLELHKGDMVAVEATPGHDVGEVTLTGKLVKLQMLKNNYRGDVKRVYRIAKPNDLEKLAEARAKEHKTMLRAREIAEELKLNMKISDVEYQGDGNKAIYYYIADERVDFRQLIKVYASEFRVKIEMKQIGARQEAGRVGGIGPCGRELCCSSSMSNFVSVSTSAARLQDIPLNPQKLAGQCGKLKCCLNFETDTYVEAQRALPSREIPLETRDSTYYHFKTDILSGTMTYSTDKYFAANLVSLPKERVFEVIRQNKKGKKPSRLAAEEQVIEEKPTTFDVLEQESISRFDNEKANNKKRRKKKKKPGIGNSSENNNNTETNKPNREPANTNAEQGENTSSAPNKNNNRNRNNRNRNNRQRNNRPPQNNNDRKENQNPQE
jgi:cell fate regulator YaaT (PSP1 superfamily)